MSFMQEAMRGYAFLNDIDRQKKDDEMRAKQFEMQQQEFDMNKQLHGQNLKLNESQLRNSKLQGDAAQLKQDQTNLLYLGAQRSGMKGQDFSGEQLMQLHKNGLVDIRPFINPETRAQYRPHFDTIKQVIAGKIHRNDPRALAAANALWASQLKRTVGSAGKGGKVIKDVLIREAHPNEKGDAMLFGLDVMYEDGTVEQHPLTENRGTEESGDNILRQVPIEDMVKHLQGQEMLLDALDHAGLDDALAKMYAATVQMSGKGKGHKPPDKLYQAAQIAQKLHATANKNRAPGDPEIPVGNFYPQAMAMVGIGGNLSPQNDNLSQYRIASELAADADTKYNNKLIPDITGLDKRDPQQFVDYIITEGRKKGIEIDPGVALEMALDKIGENVQETKAKPGTGSPSANLAPQKQKSPDVGASQGSQGRIDNVNMSNQDIDQMLNNILVPEG